MTSPAEARRAKALELHLAGATYDAIAQAVGYSDRGHAHKAVQTALTDLGRPPPPDEVLATEIARLDAMLTGLWGKARRGDVQAIDRVLKIQERRAALRQLSGADAPEKVVTALDEFTQRLAERQSSPAATRRTEGA
jgi:hypothetical protein